MYVSASSCPRTRLQFSPTHVILTAFYTVKSPAHARHAIGAPPPPCKRRASAQEVGAPRGTYSPVFSPGVLTLRIGFLQQDAARLFPRIQNFFSLPNNTPLSNSHSDQHAVSSKLKDGQKLRARGCQLPYDLIALLVFRRTKISTRS